MENPYRPRKALIKSLKKQTADVKTYTLSLADGNSLDFKPGQFVMLTLYGIGEAPFSISSGSSEKKSFDLTIRSVGDVTYALDRTKVGDAVWIRGPYGAGWPMDEAKGKNLLVIGGGIGLAPLRPIIVDVADRRREYGSFVVLYGARTPSDLLFIDEYGKWMKIENTALRLTVDAVPEGEAWDHRVGVVTILFDEMPAKPEGWLVMTCGPEIMMKFVVKGLLALGFREDQIYVSLERRMKCGVGKCGHCQVGSKYVCLNGPVFPYFSVKNLPDKIL